MGPIHQKYKANESRSRHNPKKKQKQTINKNKFKFPMQIGPMATKWQSMITKKTWDEKIVVCHKLSSDRCALTMMCGRDKEP
jgi:hypothetical protein